jgi:fatty-acyl-CoA synthase
MTDALILTPQALDPVAHWALRSPSKTAIVDADRHERWSYLQLDRRAERWRRWLVTAGVTAGDRVGLLAHNSSDHFALFVACSRSGVTLVPLNWRLTTAELTRLLHIAAVRLLLVGREFLGSAEVLDAQHVSLESVELPVDRASAPHAPRSASPQQAVMVLFTSGTSGAPTGVCLSLAQLAANSVATIEGWRLSSADVVLVSTPLFHTSGWHSLATPVLSVGGTVVVTKQFDPGALTPLLATNHCTVGFLVPTQLTMWSRTASFGAPVPTLRWMLVGGAALPTAIAEQARRVGYLVRDAYGLTEFGPNCFGWGNDSHTPIDQVGYPLPLLTCRLVDDRGAEVADGAEGELWLKGPQAPAGFLEEDAPLRSDIEWVRTGDLLRRTMNGAFTVVGRLADRFVSGGENIHPAEVEAVLRGHRDVADVAVVAVPDALWGEVGCAVVAPGHGVTLTLDELREYARARLAGYKLPRALVTVGSIPRLGSGKVDRSRLRKLVEDVGPIGRAG